MAAAPARAAVDRARRALLRAGALVWAGAALVGTAALAQSVEVLTLRFRTADELLPLLQPLVAGGVSGEGNRLFLRTTPADARAIRQLVAELDRPPRRLRLTLRHDPPPLAAPAGAPADGSIRIDSAQSSAETQPQARRPHDARSARAVTGETVLDVTEGRAAPLTMPVAVAFAFNRWQRLRDGTWLETPGGVDAEAVVGFSVRAFLRGDIVTLELAPDEATQPWAAGSRVARRAQSRLGEWFAIGGAESRSAATPSGAQTSQRGLWVRVEDLGTAAPR